MGRTEDLRSKLRAKHIAQKPDPLVKRFVDQLNAHLQTSHGFFVHSSNTWVLSLYNKAAGIAAEALPDWIATQTADQIG